MNSADAAGPGGYRPHHHPGLWVTLLLAACQVSQPSQQEPLPEAQLSRFFEYHTTIELEQPDTALITRVSGVDVRSDGVIALGDASEGNVKMYDPGGRLLRVIGRKGDGPGEFREPRFPRFDEGGRLFVADGANGRVSVFDRSGGFVRVVQLEGVPFLMSFELRPSGDGFVLTTERADGYMLLDADTSGKVTRRRLRVRDTRPRGESPAPYWRNVRAFIAAAAADTAYVVATLSDSLWTVDLNSGSEGADLITPVDYAPPRPPAEPPRTVLELSRWSRQLQLAVSVCASPAGVFVNFVKGVLNAGDPNTLVLRTRQGEWVSIRNAPAVIRATADGFVALASAGDSLTGRVALGYWRLVSARQAKRN